MAASKITRDDAQEWLQSLQLVGEGWYRQVALAVKANAHKALGMERREFAQRIGQKMIDPTEAIVELYQEGHSMKAIADVLGVDAKKTVGRTLAEQGLIEMQDSYLPSGELVGSGARSDAYEGGAERPIEGEADEVIEDLEAEIEKLRSQAKGEEARRKREVKEMRAERDKAQKSITAALKQARKEWEGKQNEADRERALKEAEAWAEEQGRKVLEGLAELGVQGVVGSLGDATDHLKLLIEEGGLTPGLIREIEDAHAAFSEELSVARAATDTATSRR